MSKHEPQKCDSNQMVGDGCESSAEQALHEIMRRACERNERKESETLTGVLAELAKESRQA